MKRSTKLLLGVASVWPLIYIFLFISFIFGMMAFSANGPIDDTYAPIFAVGVVVIFALHFLTILLSLGLTVFYIVHVIKNEGLETNIKAMWAVLLFIAGMIVQPVYWYLNIWKMPTVEASAGSLDPSNVSAWDTFETGARRDEYSTVEPPDWR